MSGDKLPRWKETRVRERKRGGGVGWKEKKMEKCGDGSVISTRI